MTLLYSTTTTTVTTTVETQVRVITEEQFVGLLSAWRTPDDRALSGRVIEVADALTTEAADEFADSLVAGADLQVSDLDEYRRRVATRWVDRFAPKVEARVAETTLLEVLA